MITVNGKDFITLNEPIFANDKRVIQVYTNNILVYPDKYPASIKVITKPTKFQYTDGEMIDLTGAVVQAYKADGSIWRSGKYINGIIPINELTCEPTTVNAQSISSNHEYAGDTDEYGPILCSSEEGQMVFLQYKFAYDPNTGMYGRIPAVRWTIKFKPTGGGVYTVAFRNRGGWLQTYFVQCTKIGEFDETQYPLEISWEAEFIVRPTYSDGSDSGTTYLGYTHTHYNVRDTYWYEDLRFYSGNYGIDYSYGSYISCPRIPYARMNRPANYIDFNPFDREDHMESSAAPIIQSETNYTYNSRVLNVMNNYAQKRASTGMKNLLGSVAVKWRRPGDGQELTADFNIAISSAVPAQ